MPTMRVPAQDTALVVTGMGVVGVGLVAASVVAAWYIALLNLVGFGLLFGAWLVWRDR